MCAARWRALQPFAFAATSICAPLSSILGGMGRRGSRGGEREGAGGAAISRRAHAVFQGFEQTRRTEPFDVVHRCPVDSVYKFIILVLLELFRELVRELVHYLRGHWSRCVEREIHEPTHEHG